MSLRRFNGFDAIPASGLSSALTEQLLSADYWYFRPNAFGILCPASIAGRLGGQCLSVDAVNVGSGSGSPDMVGVIAGSPLAEGWMGLGILVAPDQTGVSYVGVFDAVANTPQVAVAFTEFGILQLWRGTPGSGTLLAESPAGTLTFNTWNYLEIHALISATAGVVEVRLNTVPVISVAALAGHSTQASANASFDSLIIGAVPGENRVHYNFDDLYCCDPAGTVNKDFLGNARVQALLAAGPGSLTDFTQSNLALANWQCVLNQDADDTLYVFDPTVADGDLYAVSPMVNNPTVFGVQVVGAYRQTDATERFVKNQLKASGTLDKGVSTALAESYVFVTDIWELNPGTGLAFTGAEVNAAEIGPYIDA